MDLRAYSLFPVEGEPKKKNPTLKPQTQNNFYYLFLFAERKTEMKTTSLIIIQPRTTKQQMKLENWQPVIPSSLCATSSWCCCCTKLLRHFHCFRDLKDKGYEHMTNSSLLYIWPTCIYIWLNAYACAPFLWKPCGITPLQKPRWQLLLFFSFSNWRVTPKSKLPCVNCWKDLVVLHSNTSGFVFVSPSYS